VPLPFLTTDGAHDELPPHPEALRAQRAGERWRRPYALGPHRVATAAVLLVLTTYLLVAGMVVELAGNGTRCAVLLGLAVLVVATALRLLRVGVWVSGDGLRLVTLFRTTTLPWDAVGAVRTAQQPVRWLSLPRTVQGQALVIHRADGSELPTLLTDRSPDFFGRTEPFDIAADTIEDWATLLRRAPR
jgi:hypothetical protein